ncbi:MAG: hypothetical protein HY735_15995 [Verrucomicrobia bacterium]|nr:hypothetical protein [Verrucomicrobiota bacterium]
MELFTNLFGSLLAFVYHCFDRIVILGYLPLLIRPENIVHFFQNVHKVSPITKEALRKRTDEYHAWVGAFAKKNNIAMEWAGKDVRKKDDLQPELQQMKRQNRFGVYFILKSMEIGPSFRITAPKFPTKDPNYRIVGSQRSRYTHYYFYIWDEVLGPMSMCVGSFFPFSITFWINGHHFIERELLREGITFRKDDNAFLSVSDPRALQAAADRLSPDIIRKRLNHWGLALGPKFSQKERAVMNLNRLHSIQQVEYCRNFIFKRHFPIHQLYERSCDIGLMRLTADKVSNVFGFRLHKRLRGKLHTVLEKIDHGHHVLRACAKNAVLRMYEKFSTFLRIEALSNNLKDFGLKKSLDHLDAVRQKLSAVTDRFAAFEGEALNVHVDYPLFQQLALPVTSGKTRVPGIKIQDTRIIRLMEVLLHSGTKITGWRTADIHQAILEAFHLKADDYTLTQLRYDIRKLKHHALVQRDGKRYAYRLTEMGNKAALMFVLFHKRVCGPLANSLFNKPPRPDLKPATRIETAYRKADRSIEQVIQLLAA